ncbi:hypothetical protein BGX38DRAFT_1143625 [Terfezia claveryi]|nr:hypothetical protein BGX38DRAFT_1143625 [Terfezia claveryi]
MPPHRRYGRTALADIQARQVQGQWPGEMAFEELCKHNFQCWHKTAGIDQVTDNYLLHDEDLTTISVGSHTIEMSAYVRTTHHHSQLYRVLLQSTSLKNSGIISVTTSRTLSVVPGSAEVKNSDLANSLAYATAICRGTQET